MSNIKKRINKRKNKQKAIIFSSLLLAAFIGMSAIGYNTVKAWDNLVYPKVLVDGIDLSGKTKEEAVAILAENHGNAILNKKINIEVEGQVYSLEYSKLNPSYDFNAAVDQAFSYGKNLSMSGKFSAIKFSKEKNVELGLKYNKAPINELIATIEKQYNKEAVNAKLNINSGFSITPEQNGTKLNREDLEKELYSKINGKIGTNTDVKAVFTVTKANVTSDMLKGINAKVSSFSTNYGSISSPARANNIVISTRSINGTVLMPGETFSFNGVVGKRTIERGYQEAPVIVKNKVESGLGGGICQVSSTLYNAVLRANLKIAARAHHTYPSSYVPVGMDATVDYGNLDFKFTNNYSYPLYIQSSTGGGIVSFSIYSNSSLASIKCTITNDVYETIQPTTQYINDSAIAAGTTVIDQPAHAGYKVRVYRTVYKDGKQINKETISNDNFRVINGIVKVGTKPAETVPPSENAETPVEPAGETL
ncbi:MAG: VanW family protein [Clostridiaceae bacterium]